MNSSTTTTTTAPIATPTVNSNDDSSGASDATWIMTSSIVIFTMQTGFGLLESGCVSRKNEVNIMMKNAADVILGGLTYWMFGYAVQYGLKGGNPFWGLGTFFVDDDVESMGETFSTFIFQLSFATTATTIVSGAMAERTNYNAYCLFSLTNTVVYCVPAGWVWGEHGFLKEMGAIDYAGSGCVHLLGGVSALVAAALLGPRRHRYDPDYLPPVGNPINVIQGTFSLWWGWLVFNSGSSFGVSGNKWQYASRAAATTFNASAAGGLVGVIYTYVRNGEFNISDIVNAILAGLVAITAGAGYYTASQSIIIGFLGALVSCKVPDLMDYLKIDDPVSAVAVHAVGGVWGMLAVGIFSPNDDHLDAALNGRSGLFQKGGMELLAVQALAVLCITAWSAISTFILLKSISMIIPIRMTETEELLGADFCEHFIVHHIYDYPKVFRDIPPNKYSQKVPLVNRYSYDHAVAKFLMRKGSRSATIRLWKRVKAKIRALRALSLINSTGR